MQRNEIGPGESFAALSLLNGISPADYRADALVDIMWLPGEKLRLLMSQDPQLAQQVANLMQGQK